MNDAPDLRRRAEAAEEEGSTSDQCRYQPAAALAVLWPSQKLRDRESSHVSALAEAAVGFTRPASTQVGERSGWRSLT